MHVDVNSDGYADHLIERVDQVLGVSDAQELAVFAPGVASDKLSPQASTLVTQDVAHFLFDLGRWLNNANYFQENIQVEWSYIWAWGYECGVGYWDPSVEGFVGGWCFSYIYPIGVNWNASGVNFSAMAAASYIDLLGSNPEAPSLEILWSVSQIARSVLGVHLFGYQDDGVRRNTNQGGFDEATNRVYTLNQFLWFVVQYARDWIPTNQYHEFTVELDICSTTESWCTLDNIACWGRIYHAPDKLGGYGSPVQNGDTSTLRVGGKDNPIRTGVGNAAGLPARAIGNITQPGHVLHNPNAGEWGVCPKTVPQQGRGPAPQDCNQTYREPFIRDGMVWMKTRGSGYNPAKGLNEIKGPRMFRTLDEDMKRAILADPDRICPQ